MIRSQESNTNLSQVIAIDKDKCVNCHACISVCPVKFCNDGSGDHVVIHYENCIGCGNCLKACTHGARGYVDDFSSFMNDLEKGEKIVAIAAPSVAANFQGKYLNLNGWLKHNGVDAVFDVSFGAELTVKSYLSILEKNNGRTLISQPCPAIVTYMELYRPDLLPYLAQADSPMLHTMKMIQEYYPEYKNHKFAAISPCLAKRREFDETGLGDYNVGLMSIDSFLQENNLDLNDFPELDFENPPAERAVVFSSPGGLLRTAERWIPDIREKTRKVEGVPQVYEYFEKLSEETLQKKELLLIDCLNCDLGCNGGTLSNMKNSSIEEIELWIEHRNREMIAKYENDAEYHSTEDGIEEIIDRYWENDLYSRSYHDRSDSVNLKRPDESQVKEIFQSMHKYSEEDIYNCSACGYNECEKMAYAIFNGLNKPENCHFYLASESKIAQDELIELNETLEDKVKYRTLELQEKNKLIIDSIKYAQRIQNAILPWADTLEKNFNDMFIIYEPKDILSGDFYWYNRYNGNNIIAVVDCTGHGIPGSLMSMVGYMLLNEIVVEKGIRQPSEILSELNKLVRMILQQNSDTPNTDDGMDICLCSFDKKKHSLYFSGANRPLYIVRNSLLYEIKGDVRSIGGWQKDIHKSFNEYYYDLVPGDMVYMTTDGFVDQSNSCWKRFGSKKFKEILPQISNVSLPDQKDILIDKLKEHSESEKQIDDITVIGIQI